MSHGPGIRKRLAALLGFGAKPAAPSPEPDTEQQDVVSEGAPAASSEELLHNAIDFRQAKFQIGQVVQHRLFDFRGVIFDVDPVFANSEEWYEAIPEQMRPSKDQPYYHLFAENDKTHYVAYVSEGNLLPDESDTPVTHPDIPDFFDRTPDGYELKSNHAH